MFDAPEFTLSATMIRALDPERIARVLAPILADPFPHPYPNPESGSSQDTDLNRPSADVPLTTLFARIVWNTVVEPGDGDAGVLTSVLGPESCFALADGQVDSVKRALAALGVDRLDLDQAMRRWSSRLDLDRVVALCQSSANLGLRFVAPEHASYPRQLDDLASHAPQGLWVRGELEALSFTARSVAVVGARASTPYGDRVAGDLAAEVSSRELAVVSGGAYGIDAAAHRAALASSGATIAVLAGGTDRLYPAGNRALLERICAEGAVVSEASLGQSPTRWRFLQRNRLIAALSQATVVVEAGARSGALNTANHAMHLGRPLGAVPGPVTSASSAGCHRLLKEGHAQLVANASDVLELWGEGSLQLVPERESESFGGYPEHGHQAPASADPRRSSTSGVALSAAATRVRDALRPRRRQSVLEISRECGMSARDVRAGLSELQLMGLAEDSDSGWRKLQTPALF